MPLTAAEQMELDALKRSTATPTQPPGLSQAEQVELKLLQEQLGAQQRLPRPSAQPALHPTPVPMQQTPPPVIPTAGGTPSAPTPVPQQQGFMQQIDQAAGEIDAQKRQPGVDLTELGATSAGEMLGRYAGAFGGLLAPVTVPLGGAFGAAAGLAVDRKLSGKKVTVPELGMEFGMSIVPGVLGEALAKPIRKVFSRTSHGIKAGEQTAGRWLRDNIDNIIKPPNKEAVDQLFDLVRKSGDQMAPSSFRKGVRNLTDHQWDMVHSELGRISAGPKNQYDAIGEEAQRAFQAVRDGTPAFGFDLGKLTHVRSQIRKAASSKKDGATHDALDRFVEVLDEGIQKGTFMKGGKSGPILDQARKEYAKLMDFEDISALIHRRGITSPSRGGKHIELNFGSLKEELTNPSSRIGKMASAALARDPVGKANLEATLARLGKVNLEPGFLAKTPAVSYAASGIAMLLGSGPAARERFVRIVEGRRGRISMEEFAVLVNGLRRGVGQISGSGQDEERPAVGASPGY